MIIWEIWVLENICFINQEPNPLEAASHNHKYSKFDNYFKFVIHGLGIWGVWMWTIYRIRHMYLCLWNGHFCEVRSKQIQMSCYHVCSRKSLFNRDEQRVAHSYSPNFFTLYLRCFSMDLIESAYSCLDLLSNNFQYRLV